MKPINYYTEYKNRKPKTNISFKTWLSINYSEINIKDLDDAFFKWWFDSNLNYLNNNVWILYFCKNYKTL